MSKSLHDNTYQYNTKSQNKNLKFILLVFFKYICSEFRLQHSNRQKKQLYIQIHF